MFPDVCTPADWSSEGNMPTYVILKPAAAAAAALTWYDMWSGQVSNCNMVSLACHDTIGCWSAMVHDLQCSVDTWLIIESSQHWHLLESPGTRFVGLME